MNAKEIVGQIRGISSATTMDGGRVHESCFESWGLLRLAETLLEKEWPQDAIVVAIELAKLLKSQERDIAELKQKEPPHA